ncbi:MAG: BACON domain-containing protein [Bacteroidales bacterium]|nr:BACON domain-containing protein [Bacteroidales bacterium]
MKNIANIRLFAIGILLSSLTLSGCIDGSDCCFPNVFLGSETSIAFDGLGGTKSIDVVCSMSWTVLTKPSWISNVSPNFGAGGLETLYITADPNDQPQVRYGDIVLQASNGDKLTIKVTQSDDPLFDFMSDDTPRWENLGAGTKEINKEHPYIYITEKAGVAKLFGTNATAHFKSGRITQNNGSAFEIITFDDDPFVGGIGPYTGGLYNESNTVTPIALDYLSVVKIVGDKLWIVFKVNPGDSERRIVQ